jgi:fucose permease
MSTEKRGMFVTADGQNLAFTFILVSSLFLLWGLCNGMIDVMDKHFQDELGLTKSQSAWVQFAHYLGYFLMAMPAGWLASRLGYKGGIIAGLVMVALGGFWFLPATRINALAQAGDVTATTAFIAYLTGVCAIAAGLTFLETIANPYTTVLGPQRYAATRINLAQSCNGIGWIFGPILGGMFFYSTDASGVSTGSETLYIPYVIVAFVVLALSAIFYFARVPDIKAEDDYHMDDSNAANNAAGAERQVRRGQVYCVLWLNAAVLLGICGMIVWLIVSAFNVGPKLVGAAASLAQPFGLKVTAHNSLLVVICGAVVALSAVAAIAMIPVARRLSHHSMWSHPHFGGATLAQFLYVAAQAGIFSFLINYMTEEPPSLPAAWQTSWTAELIGVRTRMFKDDIQDLPVLVERLEQNSDAVSAFLNTQLSDETKQALKEHRGEAADPTMLRILLAQDLNKVVQPNPKKGKKLELLYDAQRFSAVKLSDTTRQVLADKQAASEKVAAEKRLLEDGKLEGTENREAEKRLKGLQRQEGSLSTRLNRMLLTDAYPGAIRYDDTFIGISDKLGAWFVTFGFFCFFIGRYTGANLLKRFSAHKVVALYGALNVACCLLVFLKLGWLSVACVFLSYLFMSIMFPTIFALGIFGLGARAKKASAFIVMAIMGGAVLPKLMGQVADQHDMSRGFIVPAVCFACVALYGWIWPKLSNAESLHGVGRSRGH